MIDLGRHVVCRAEWLVFVLFGFQVIHSQYGSALHAVGQDMSPPISADHKFRMIAYEDHRNPSDMNADAAPAKSMKWNDGSTSYRNVLLGIDSV
ncbi:hypothetical protein [Rhizobium sp. FY34]|uniref:hypothetical protein n=1 Tax=Rhizobium sp. FY34 TaxID=2562309 RepID=UPI0010BFEAF4|nr:hypothetical protein [Rhizobium sp. FY34]